MRRDSEGRDEARGRCPSSPFKQPTLCHAAKNFRSRARIPASGPCTPRVNLAAVCGRSILDRAEFRVTRQPNCSSERPPVFSFERISSGSEKGSPESWRRLIHSNIHRNNVFDSLGNFSKTFWLTPNPQPARNAPPMKPILKVVSLTVLALEDGLSGIWYASNTSQIGGDVANRGWFQCQPLSTWPAD